jgi:ubiquinone/menaquinone biosynthesis C-methylase UbiE/ribosomal protein L40E
MLELSDVIVCPKCQSDSFLGMDSLQCIKCDFTGLRYKNIMSTLCTNNSYFDELHQVMVENNGNKNVFKLCYEKQIKTIEDNLKDGMVVVDVGCGPSIPYKKPDNVFLIGVEPSLSSLMSNSNIDLPLHSSATNLPLKDSSVDMIICLYSIHHMTGATKQITRENVKSAFNEFNRIIKPDGKILIFEVNPWSVFYVMENIGWNLVKNILKSKCDFYFWSRNAILKLGSNSFKSANVTSQKYDINWNDTFPPAFSLQWLKVPRFLYPFDVNGYQWSFRS